MVRNGGRTEISARDRERIDAAMKEYEATRDAATLEYREKRNAAQLARDKVIVDIISNGKRGTMASIYRYLGYTVQTVRNMKQRVAQARANEEFGDTKVPW